MSDCRSQTSTHLSPILSKARTPMMTHAGSDTEWAPYARVRAARTIAKCKRLLPCACRGTAYFPSSSQVRHPVSPHGYRHPVRGCRHALLRWVLCSSRTGYLCLLSILAADDNSSNTPTSSPRRPSLRGVPDPRDFEEVMNHAARCCLSRLLRPGKRLVIAYRFGQQKKICALTTS